MKQLLKLGAAAALVVTSGCDGGGPATESAPPVDERAQGAVDVRQSVLTLMKWNFVPMVLMAQDKIAFDGAVVQEKTERLSQLIAMMNEAFAPDTRGTGVETEALDKIWEQPEAFAEKIENVAARTEALAAVVDSGDPAIVKPAIVEVGKACGSCHDDFREDDD